VIVRLEIASVRKARSMNSRHAGLSISPNRPSLRTRITPADGNETAMSSELVVEWLMEAA
jgi:hypothetical protein